MRSRPYVTGAAACAALVVASAIGRAIAAWGVAAPWIAPDGRKVFYQGEGIVLPPGEVLTLRGTQAAPVKRRMGASAQKEFLHAATRGKRVVIEAVQPAVDGGRLIVEAHPRLRYTLDEALAQCDPSAEPTEEERGCVRCDQPGALDLDARGGRKLETVPAAVIDEVLAKLAPLFD